MSSVTPAHDGADPFDDNPASDMTDAERELLGRWLRDAADQLGLRDWRISLSRHRAEQGDVATSFIRESSDEAVVALEKGWRDSPERRLRSSLVHELLHCHFERIVGLSARLVKSELGRRTEAVIEEALKYQQELIIERLAWGISGLLRPVYAKEEPDAS